MGEAKRVFLVILVIEGRMRFKIEMVTEMIEAKCVDGDRSWRWRCRWPSAYMQ